MKEPIINVLTRFSRKEGIVRSLQSLNEQTYSNIKHYITYETTEGLEHLKTLEYKYPTEFIRVPNYKRIKNLYLYYEHHDGDTDYLNWDWEKWDVQVIHGDKIPPRKVVKCNSRKYAMDRWFCCSLDHSIRKRSPHGPYNMYLKIAEAYVKEGWISYLDDDDVYTSENSISDLACEIKEGSEDTFHLFRVKREARFKENLIPSDKFFRYHVAGHPIIMGEIGGACICFHSKYKEYTQWGHWAGDDYRTVKVLEKVIPHKNFINKVLYDAFKAGKGL